jgi:hypothetical protein
MAGKNGERRKAEFSVMGTVPVTHAILVPYSRPCDPYGNGCPEGRPASKAISVLVLIFWFFCIKTKEQVAHNLSLYLDLPSSLYFANL